MTFKDQMSVDMANVFMNTGEFAEEITYTDKTGIAKAIPAIIDRSPIKPGSEDQARVLRKEAEILIYKADSDDGVASVSTKGDKVCFPAIPGGCDVEWDIVSIIEAGDFHWKLLVSQ